MLFGQDGASASLYGDLSRCTLCRRTVLCFSMTENRTVIFDRDINRYARYSTVTDFCKVAGMIDIAAAQLCRAQRDKLYGCYRRNAGELRRERRKREYGICRIRGIFKVGSTKENRVTAPRARTSAMFPAVFAW